MSATEKKDTCPSCEQEGTLRDDHESWYIHGDELLVPVVCSECGTHSTTHYQIEFLYTNEINNKTFGTGSINDQQEFNKSR